MEFASKGVAGAALGTGIAGLALSVLNGGLGNLGNNGSLGSTDININAPDVEVARLRRGGVYAHGGGGYNNYVSHYELGLVQQLAAKDAVIVDKDAKLYTNQEIAKVTADFNAFKLETERRFCYDEKLIAENKCEIEKIDAYGKCNYYKMDKVIRPWDICPKPWETTTSTDGSAIAASSASAKTNKATA